MFAAFDIYEQRGLEKGLEKGRKEEHEKNLKALTKKLMKRDPSLSLEAAKKEAEELLAEDDETASE